VLRESTSRYAPNLNSDKALIFRITHRDNIPWILDHGLHAPNSSVSDPNFRSIGSIDLIDKRGHRAVAVGPGGTLRDYIPFYFTPFSIMLFNIHTGRNVPHVPNDQIVILVSSLRRVTKFGIPFVFTDRHAYTLMANYFTNLDDLDKINWEILNRRDFRHDPDDPAKKEQYQAEARIWKQLPLEGLLGICCYTAPVNDWLQAELAKRKLTMQTRVQGNWYF
jgi:hypothetical protein